MVPPVPDVVGSVHYRTVRVWYFQSRFFESGSGLKKNLKSSWNFFFVQKKIYISTEAHEKLPCPRDLQPTVSCNLVNLFKNLVR
jgi:hypothetical protein